MVQKIHAAVDARKDDHLCVIARTDARATLGLTEAIDRAHAYQEAGADIIFLEAPQSVAEIETVPREVSGPQIINNVRGGSTPELPHKTAQELGFAIALYANLPLLASVAAVQATLTDLRENGTSEGAVTQAVATWTERQRLVRRDLFQDLEDRYAT
jgi:2-methylisocitrate lyase-like PEP mutase family enzyme